MKFSIGEEVLFVPWGNAPCVVKLVEVDENGDAVLLECKWWLDPTDSTTAGLFFGLVSCFKKKEPPCN